MTNKRKKKSQMDFIGLAAISIFVLLVIMAALPFLVSTLGKTSSVCQNTMKSQVAAVKDRISSVCNDPASAGALTEFSPTASGCELQTKLVAATCDKLGLLLSTATVTNEHPFETILVVSALVPSFPGKVYLWTVAAPSAYAAEYGTSGRNAPPAGIDVKLMEIFQRALDAPVLESTLAEASSAFNGDASGMPLEDLGSFVSNDLDSAINSGNILMVPAGLDKTIIISDSGGESVTPEISSGNLEMKAIIREWKGALTDKLTNAYLGINGQVVVETELSRNAPRISEVFSPTSDGLLTLKEEKVEKLAGVYADFVRRDGGRLAGESEQFRTLSGENPWLDFIGKVESFNDRGSLFEGTTCKGTGNFCSVSADFSEKLSGTLANFASLSERYSRISEAKASAIEVIEGKIRAGECDVYSGPGYRIPTCAVMVSCTSEDEKLYSEIQKDSCIISALNLEGSPPSVFPVGAIPRKGAREVWDLTLSDKHLFTGSCSSYVPFECPYFSSLTNSEEAKRTVLLCIKNEDPRCVYSGNCYCCETVYCANTVEFHTRISGRTTAENVGSFSGTPEGGGLVTEISGAVYPFCGQEGGFFSTNSLACIAESLQNNQALSGTAAATTTTATVTTTQ
ncbi:MAG: hypothetical protein V1820_01175 [archaeon]